jgi:hypothetical protein
MTLHAAILRAGGGPKYAPANVLSAADWLHHVAAEADPAAANKCVV